MTSPAPPMSRNLSGQSTAELLAGYAATLLELRRRAVVRSGNAPAGDYAEWIVARATKGTLVKNFSVKSYDLTLPTGERVQVKARVVSDVAKGSQLQTSPFRSWDFHFAAFVLFDNTDYSVRHAVLVPKDTVESVAQHRPHVNGHVVFMTPELLAAPGAINITEKARTATKTR